MFCLRKFYIFIIIFYCCNFAKQDTESFGSKINKENGLDIKMLTSTVIRQKRSILDTLLSSIFYDDSLEDSDAAADNEKYLICRNCKVIVHKDDSKMPTPPNNTNLPSNGMNPVNNTNTAPTTNSTTMS